VIIIRTSLEHWDHVFESYSKHGCLSAFVLSCVGSGPMRGWSPFQGIPPIIYQIHNFIINSGWEENWEPNPSRQSKKKKLLQVSSASTVPSKEADTSSARKGILRSLWKAKIYYCVHKTSPLAAMHRQINSVQNFISVSWFKNHFNNIPFTSTLSRNLLLIAN
jgi:hypothetical protein